MAGCCAAEADLPRLNLNLRTGERVLLVLGSFPAEDFDALFEGTKALPWEQFIPRNGQFPVKGHSLNSALHSVPACQSIVKKAVAAARRRATVVTLGITPDFPATGFGYVDPETGRFAEKPDLRTAKTYLRRGYLWNAGMFIARAETFRAAFAAHAPQLEPLLAPRVPRLASVYAALPKISFDFAVMEPLSRRPGAVSVVPGEFGWDDVGSFAAFDTYFPHDSRGNVREGPCTAVEADGNICVARSARISLLGVKNLVVVTTPDAVLVADKSRLGEMKRLFRK